MSVSAEYLKESLTEYLQPLPDALSDLERAASAVSRITDDRVDLPWSHTVLHNAYKHWLERQIHDLSLDHQGETSKMIELSDLDHDLLSVDSICPHLRHNMLNDEMIFADAVAELLSAVPYEAMAEELNILAKNLESAGFTEAAKYIADKFNCESRNVRYYQPSRTKRHYLFEAPLHLSIVSGYGFDVPRWLHQLAESFLLVEKDTGLSGLANSIRVVRNEIDRTDEVFPSRTVLAEGMPIECVIFKEHMKFRVSHDVADAIFAFIRIHSDVELYDFDAQDAA